jgi:hypothetical protein
MLGNSSLASSKEGLSSMGLVHVLTVQMLYLILYKFMSPSIAAVDKESCAKKASVILKALESKNTSPELVVPSGHLS